LTGWRDRLEQAYGPAAAQTRTLDVAGGAGTLADLVEFCRLSVEG
jgi:hypothetical protein